MKRYLTLIGLIIAFLLLLFFAAEYLQIPLLNDPTPLLSKRSTLTAGLGVLLLTADVAIPVPTSLIMTANGIYFGIGLGCLLSLIGSLGASFAGFLLGRYSAPIVHRLLSDEDWLKGQALLAEWGMYAVILTRPIPILAETMAIIAGTSSISWYRMAISSTLGLLPPVILFSAAGAMTARAYSTFPAFLLSLVIAAGLWWFGRFFKKGPQKAVAKPKGGSH